MAKILAIDYGTRYIGLAIADKKIKIAHPYLLLDNRGKNFVLEALKKIIAKENINKIIVGRPIGLSGRETEQTKITDEFINFLRNNLSIKVESFDERFTTKLSRIKDQGSSTQHSGAAAIILQDYLERARNV